MTDKKILNQFSSGKYAAVNFQIPVSEYYDAWLRWYKFYRDWLPESGFQPDNRPTFEEYYSNPNKRDDHRLIFKIFIPIKPL